MRLPVISTRALMMAGCASICAAHGIPAFAQSTQNETVQERDSTPDEASESQIVVTGTSIRGVAAIGSNSVALGSEEIKETGAADLVGAARTLPVVLNIGADESRTSGAQDAAANSSRLSTINLRGLGPEATLVLLNGRRLPAGGILRALTDPGVVSANSTRRLEVVLDGASAIYGADAVAGVVNIITRRRFDGAETNLRYGFGDDIDEVVAGQNFGSVWDTGDLFASAEYHYRSNLPRQSRDFLSQDLRPYGGLDQRSTQAPVPNLVIGSTRLPLPDLTGEPNRYDLTGDFLPETERYNGFLSVRQDLADTVRIWAEGFISRRHVATQNAPIGGSFTVPSTNAFYMPGLGGVPAGQPQRIEYRLPREGAVSRSRETTAQIAAGVDWELSDTWQVSTYFAHNIYDGRSGLGGEQINNFAAARLLASSDPDEALNVYGGPISDAVYDEIIAFRHQIVNFRSDHFEAKLDGPLLEGPGGPIRLAVGAAYEFDEFRYREFQSALSPTNDASVTNDGINRREIASIYGELFIPLFSPDNKRPLMQSLSVSLAGRFDDYSDFGSTTNPKISAVWEPVDGLALRGSWGQSFRAPSLVDTGNLNFAFVFPVPDPANGGQLINQLLWTGSNPELEPETSETWSVGFDLNPKFLPGFSANVSYYNVEYENRIEGVAASLANEAIYRQFIIRNPSADIVNFLFNSGWLVTAPIPVEDVDVLVDARRNNVGSLEVEGVDVNLNYEFDTSIGTLSAGITHTELFHVYRQTFPAFPVMDVVDLFENPLKSRGRASLGLRTGGFNATLFYNYAGDYINTAVVPNVEVSAQKTFDLFVGYSFEPDADILGGLQLSLSVQNLFDTDPPVVLNGNNAWDSQTANGIGRFVALGITKRW